MCISRSLSLYIYIHIHTIFPVIYVCVYKSRGVAYTGYNIRNQ